MFFRRFSADKTKNLIGISETLIATAISGVIFSLFAGQPLLIVGTTGPLLLFDEALFNVSFGETLQFKSISDVTNFVYFFLVLSEQRH